MNPKITIIILNWNGWEDTVECLESFYQIDYPNYNVILVDNNSHDDSISKIKKYCEGRIEVKSDFFEYNPNNKPIKLIEYSEKEINHLVNNKYLFPDKQRLIIIKNDENHGFAKGNNIGMKYALNTLNSDYILLLNNDTVVDRKFLNELIDIAESDDKIGAVGPKTYYYNEKNMIQWTAGGFIEPEYFKVESIGPFEIDKGQYDKNQELDYIIGSCVLCKREVIEKVGLLDHGYFMYFEDVDWSLRILRSNYKCVYAYKSKIWHKMGVSSSTCFKTHYYHMNRIYLFKKYSKRTEYIKSLLRFIFTVFPRESYGLIHSYGIKYYPCYLRGIINGVTKK